MNKKKIGAICLVVLVSLLAGFIFFGGKTNAPATQNTADGTAGGGTEIFTLKEVETHNSASDCWTIVNGSVYDITSYVPRHPGGTEILLACGKDGTTLFTKRTTSDGQKIGSGTPHDSTAESQLASLKIGVLKQ